MSSLPSYYVLERHSFGFSVCVSEGGNLRFLRVRLKIFLKSLHITKRILVRVIELYRNVIHWVDLRYVVFFPWIMIKCIFKAYNPADTFLFRLSIFITILLSMVKLLILLTLFHHPSGYHINSVTSLFEPKFIYLYWGLLFRWFCAYNWCPVNYVTWWNSVMLWY